MDRSKQLKQIAVDIVDGKVFTSMHLEPHDMELLSLVFMPFAFDGLKDFPPEKRDNIVLVYEYLKDAGPRSINGHPMFFSCNFIYSWEADEFWGYYEEYSKQKENFLK